MYLNTDWFLRLHAQTTKMQTIFKDHWHSNRFDCSSGGLYQSQVRSVQSIIYLSCVIEDRIKDLWTLFEKLWKHGKNWLAGSCSIFKVISDLGTICLKTDVKKIKLHNFHGILFWIVELNFQFHLPSDEMRLSRLCRCLPDIKILKENKQWIHCALGLIIIITTWRQCTEGGSLDGVNRGLESKYLIWPWPECRHMRLCEISVL